MQQPSRRKGSILVIVAGGLVALMLFAAIAVDVGFMHLTRARLNAMSEAAALAGYEKLKEVQFDYHGNQAAVDGVIRSYLRSNGATSTEAANATITVSRRGRVEVQVRRDSPFFFGAVSGQSSQLVAGLGLLEANNIGPYGVPTTYQDPDRDGVANWDTTDESIKTSPNPWAWELNKPYIVKFGTEEDGLGTSEDYLFIPMDDEAHNITLSDASVYTLPAQGVTGELSSNKNGNKAARASTAPTTHGIIRAYGIAYDVLGLSGVSETPVFWILGYDGGSFFISAAALTAAGYTWSSEVATANQSYEVTLQKGGSTGVKALYLKVSGPSKRPADVKFIQKIDALASASPAKIKLLGITKQPQIATFTKDEDPVTQTMITAGIPFTAFYLNGSTTSYHDFNVDPKVETEAQILTKLESYDWLHLHHENFVEGYGATKTDYADKKNLVTAIRKFIAEKHRFMMTACEATETLDIALARAGSPSWTATGGSPSGHGGNIDYSLTFAFQDFYIKNSAMMQGNQAFSGDYSEIDTEDDAFNYHYVDYLHPLTQNHQGFGGIDFLEESDTVSATYSSSDVIVAGGGKTTTFRHAGTSTLHSDHDIVKPHEMAVSGITVPQYVSSGGVGPGDASKKVMILAQQTSNSPGAHDVSKQLRYLSGVLDDDSDLENGFGRWSYISGHEPNKGLTGGHDVPTGTTYEFEDLVQDGSTKYEDKGSSDKQRWFREAILGYDLNGDGDTTDDVPIRDVANNSPAGTGKCPTGTARVGQNRWNSWSSDKMTVKDLDCNNVNGGTIADAIKRQAGGGGNGMPLEGMRLYLNNILFGATAGLSPGGGFVTGTGAINPANLALGDSNGQFGAMNFTGNAFGTMFKVGSKKLGLPVGAQFKTAPGTYQTQTQSAFDYMFLDTGGNRISKTWVEYQALSPQQKAADPQLATVAVIERIPVAATTPTPYSMLDDYMDGSNTARPLSIYGANTALPADDPSQARNVHVLGFLEFFLVDPVNQNPDTQNSADDSNFVAAKWREGEVRGYLTRVIQNFGSAQLYPATPDADPR